MNLLSVKELSKIGREAPLFTGVTFGLDEGDKAALIGRNGTGKSTLLNCIAGVIVPDEGQAIFNKDAGVSFLPQNPEFNPEDTIREHIFSRKTDENGRITGKSDADTGKGSVGSTKTGKNSSSGGKGHSGVTVTATSPKLAIIHEYERLCDAIAEGDSSTKLKNDFETVSQLMADKDLWTYEAEVKSILTTLGISGHFLDNKMKTLSGGMIKKVALAQVLVEDTKVLLLDEPTNHLDIMTITWLEDYLRNTKRSVLMVTHDRYFLDAVCSDIYELEHGKFNHYQGNFSQYLDKKATEQEIAENTERRIESVLRVERDWLMRGPCARGTKARARVDNIHRLINREKLKTDKGFSFEVTGRRLGGKILELKNISKNYIKAGVTDKFSPISSSSSVASSVDATSAATGSSSAGVPVLTDFSYTFKKNERIGIFGNNGSGKSTLLNIITGNLAPDSGEIDKGINTVFGYYMQNPVFKDTNLSVLEYLKEAAEYVTLNNGKTLSASQLLEQFGFEGKILYSPLVSLSGGERKRVYLIRLLLSNPNFLVLDEPTNDFDIFTMSILESFLENFPGCILVVSHDRCFMDKIADTLFILEDDGSVSGYVGKCTEYLDYLKEKEAEEHRAGAAQRSKDARSSGEGSLAAGRTSPATAESGQNSKAETLTTTGAKAADKPRRRTFKEQKEYETIEEEIFSLEDRKSELEALLSGGESDHSKLADYGREYAELTPKLEEKYARWEELGLLEEY
ncbi:MAG: ABC-F family ATP-binding cassette domain-containing protein [Treponemataceae bacterium]|nr:ABC-F family ATP-binding cassette domain-containing protein [Treponemataceae bacterium]